MDDKLLNDYIKHMKLYRKDEKTIEAYVVDITQFFNYIKKDINEIKNDDIEKYKDYMIQERKLKISSVNRKLIALSTFFKYHQVPILIIQEKVQQQQFLNNLLTSEDIEKMLHQAKAKNDYRAYALIFTLKSTGLRVSELLQLTVDDVNEKTIVICGKGKKYRKAMISDKLREVWKEYLPHRIKKGQALFTGKRGAITRNTVLTTMKKYGKLAGIDEKKCFSHNTRHQVAKLLCDKNVPIETVADILGHASVETSRIYTRHTEQELLDIINTL